MTAVEPPQFSATSTPRIVLIKFKIAPFTVFCFKCTMRLSSTVCCAVCQGKRGYVNNASVRSHVRLLRSKVLQVILQGKVMWGLEGRGAGKQFFVGSVSAESRSALLPKCSIPPLWCQGRNIITDVSFPFQGFVPMYVNATAGTTVYGAFDPINEIADICEKYNMWLHVDVRDCSVISVSN